MSDQRGQGPDRRRTEAEERARGEAEQEAEAEAEAEDASVPHYDLVAALMEGIGAAIAGEGEEFQHRTGPVPPGDGPSGPPEIEIGPPDHPPGDPAR